MSVLSAGMVGASGVDTGDITKSLRFRASGSTYLTRTPSAGSQTTWTFSCWMKRGGISALRGLFGANTTNNDAGRFYLLFNADDTLTIEGWTTLWRRTTQVFRDPSAWMHIVVALDTSNATAGSRVKLYVNGVEVTAFSTTNNPSLSQTLGVNTAGAHNIGRDINSGSLFDGYLSRICFVDGQALTPSSFGQLNTEINEWVSKSQSAVKAVVDAGGTNSFMLEFDDGASLTALGYSKSSPYEASNFTDMFTNVTKVDNGDGTWRWTFGNVTSLMRLSGLSNPGSGVPITVSFRVRRVSGGSTFPIDFGDQGPTDVFSELTLNTWVVVTKTFTTNGSGAFVDFPNDGNHNGLVLDVDYVSISHQSNWTLTNHSITAGTSYDWMEDRPGNSFCTLNPLVINSGQISGANLTFNNSGSSYRVIASQGITSGKWYWEIQSTNGSYTISSGLWKLGAASTEVLGFGDALSWGWYASSGQKWFNSAGTNWGSAFTAVTDVLGVAFDADSGDLYFYKNGSLQGGGAAFTGLTSGPYFPGFHSNVGGTTSTVDFGQAPLFASATYDSASGGYFRYTPPSGYKALCTANLDTPAILNPLAHFDVNLRTGTGASFSVTGKSLAPDLVWVKERSGADGHRIFSRGLTHAYTYIDSSATAAETNNSNNLTSFNSDGFSGGSGLGTTGFNDNTATYVDWLWKANGAAVTNLYTYSQDFSNAAWNQQSITPTYSQSAPDGSSTATLFLAGSGYTTLWRVSITITANSTNTVSMYFKAGTSSTASIAMGNAGLTNSITCTFNLATGVAGSPSYAGTSSGGVASMTSAGGGWYRCSLSGVIDNSTTLMRTDFSVPNTQSLYMWGAQAQSGSTATPYIPNAAIIATVSANQTAGFSIVTYTGTGANATVGHSLGVAPKLVIVKCRSNANDWPAYHASNTAAPETDYLLLNSTAATADDNTYWNDTAPTTTVFSIGTNTDVNTNTYTYVAYCFAEIAGFSKIGSYTGNGSADGPFVFCGFKPRFVLIKRSDSANDWGMFDSARSTYNVNNAAVGANTAFAESSYGSTDQLIDFTANGFKLKTSTSNMINGSGGTYIFYAVAETAGKYSNAR